jgi:3'-phosphoadenosine 5'-phosphosulfate sulfotransferase (PAPS reductase)/FAD synthetase
MTESYQSKLITPPKVMLTTKSPKGHKLRMPKKLWLDYHEPDTMNFDGIMNKIEELLPNHQNIVGLSGGKDSGVVLHKLLDNNMIDRAFYIKTNIGVQATEDFVKDTCLSLGIPLDIREPTPHAFVYVAICLEVGFPSYELHNMIMAYLKYKTMMKYVMEKQFKKRKAVLCSGVRKYESQRRKFNYNQPINVDSGKLYFACPVFYETDEEVYRYYLDHKLKKSPTYTWANTSFECACGSFAGKSDLEGIKINAPELYDFLMWIKDGIEKFGTPTAKKYNQWGMTRPWDEAQRVLTKYLGDDLQHSTDVSQMICGSECGAGTMRGTENY